IEREVLWIPQTTCNPLEIRTVRIAPQHGPFVGQSDGRSLPRRHIETAVADAEVKLAIGAETEAVHVVSVERYVHAIPGLQRFALVGMAGPLRVPEQPQRRNARVINTTLAREHTGAEAVFGMVKAVGKDGGTVGNAVTVRIGQQAHTVMGNFI